MVFAPCLYSGFPKELLKAAMHGNPEICPIYHRHELREPLVYIFHTHCWSQNCGSARFGILENQDLLDYSSKQVEEEVSLSQALSDLKLHTPPPVYHKFEHDVEQGVRLVD